MRVQRPLVPMPIEFSSQTDPMQRSPNPIFHFRCLAAPLVLLSIMLLSIPASSDEWKPRHDLVSHTGVMNLNELPPPSEVFFPGPASASDQPGWLEGLKAWRNDRRTLLRYSGAQYARPELLWTQR